MSAETVAVANRVRASAGSGGALRSLLWWLRPPQRSSSDESVSSAGSDRTAISFAFLPPASYRAPKPAVGPLPPPGPPTDSYRRRIRDRDLRRHLDREITLQRKYRLPLAADGSRPDASTLPSARRTLPVDRQERARRAISECGQRRVAYVPGKRRAPQPPASTSRLAASGATLPRRSSRKRRAPPPPAPRSTQRLFTIDEKPPMPDDNMNLKTKTDHEKRPVQQPTRSVKEDNRKGRNRNVKTKSEVLDHSFFRHCKIFESKKRASTSDSPPIRILPNISELDKQASEIYETCKLRGNQENDNFKLTMKLRDGHPWICTKCLKKYSADVVVCPNCYLEKRKFDTKINQEDVRCTVSADCSGTENVKTRAEPNHKNKEKRISFLGLSTDQNQYNKEDKEKLKEILKEMKHSLPTHHKPEKIQSKNNVVLKKEKITNTREPPDQIKEVPTLRIGSSIQTEFKDLDSEMKTENQSAHERAIITQTVVLSHLSEMKTETQSNIQAVKEKDAEKGNLRQNSFDNSKKNSHSENLNNIITPTPGSSNCLNNDNKKTTKDNKETIDHDKYQHSSILKLLNINQSPEKSDNLDAQTKMFLNFDENESVDVISQTPKQKQISKDEMKIDHVKNSKTNNTDGLKQANLISTSQPFKDLYQAKDDKSSHSQAKNTNAFTSKTALSSKLTISENDSKHIESTSTKEVKPQTSALVLNSENRRRELANRLEWSISQGDERAAAEAATELAKMRATCSVLAVPAIPKVETPVDISKPLTITSLINSLVSNAPPQNASMNSTNVFHATRFVQPGRPTSMIMSKDLKSNAIQEQLSFLTNKSTVNQKSSVGTRASAIRNDNHKTSRSSDVATANILNSNEPELKLPDPKITSFDPDATQRESNFQTVDVIVEDREVQRGPVVVRVPRGATVGELRRRCERALAIPGRLQRWIIGKTLCSDDEAQLVTLAGPALDAPFYLCLVESETNREENCTKIGDTSFEAASGSNVHPKRELEKDVYQELMALERCALVATADAMECGVCLEACAAGAGAVLRECLHAYCRACLADAVRHCDEPLVCCPATGCPAHLQEREIRALVSAEEYEKWLARGLAAAESGARHAFHCRTADCGGWALCEPGVRRFHCPVCTKVNCVPCQAIHEGETCEQHRARVLAAPATQTGGAATARDVDEGTRALLDSLVARGEALECPECNAIITKKWGCDWVRCSACKTEICWATRGRRWGPGGRGDTSAGCRCGVDGRRCHPSCSYCH